MRPAFAELLRFQDFSLGLEAEHLEIVDKSTYVREKLLLRTAQHSVMPVYLLIPKGGKGPLPTVLAFHGCGYGVKHIVGLWEDGTERESPDGLYRSFAVALCERGFAVAALETVCFGERQTDFSALTIGWEAPTSCMHAAILALHLGGSVARMRVPR